MKLDKLSRVMRIRMLWCAVYALALLLAVAWIAPQQVPVIVYKVNLILLASVAGYWLDRWAFPYARPDRFLTADGDVKVNHKRVLARPDSAVYHHGRGHAGRGDGAVKPNWGLIGALSFCALFWLLAWTTWAHCAPSIPQRAQQHRALLTREARMAWGLDAPVATFAAQIHQESLWRDDARSHAGAQGLAQFMPTTSRWLPEVAPETGEPLAVFAVLVHSRHGHLRPVALASHLGCHGLRPHGHDPVGLQRRSWVAAARQGPSRGGRDGPAALGPRGPAQRRQKQSEFP